MQVAKTSVTLWIVAYLVLMVGVALGMLWARQHTIASLSTPQARQQWQEWKAETARMQQHPGPVTRRQVKIDEPPGLVLMRDSFVPILAGALAISSCFFAFFALIGRGMWASRGAGPSPHRTNPRAPNSTLPDGPPRN